MDDFDKIVEEMKWEPYYTTERAYLDFIENYNRFYKDTQNEILVSFVKSVLEGNCTTCEKERIESIFGKDRIKATQWMIDTEVDAFKIALTRYYINKYFK